MVFDKGALGAAAEVLTPGGNGEVIIHTRMIFVMTHFPIAAVAHLAYLAAKATTPAKEAATLAAPAEVEARLTIVLRRKAGKIGVVAKGAEHLHDVGELFVALLENLRGV